MQLTDEFFDAIGAKRQEDGSYQFHDGDCDLLFKRIGPMWYPRGVYVNTVAEAFGRVNRMAFRDGERDLRGKLCALLGVVGRDH